MIPAELQHPAIADEIRELVVEQRKLYRAVQDLIRTTLLSGTDAVSEDSRRQLLSLQQ